MAGHAGRAGSLIFCCELLPVPRIRLLSRDTNLFLSLKSAIFKLFLQLAYTAAATLVCLAHSYCFIFLILIHLFHHVYKWHFASSKNTSGFLLLLVLTGDKCSLEWAFYFVLFCSWMACIYFWIVLMCNKPHIFVLFFCVFDLWRNFCVQVLA